MEETVIYDNQRVKEIVVELLKRPENEVVEFKEAKSSYDFKTIGKYFSAISNETCLRDLKCGWLLFGITNQRSIVGSSYRLGDNLQNLKRDIANCTNDRLTFLEISEVYFDNKRVLAFQIPPAIPGTPTTWNGAAYAREGESISPLPMNKLDEIRSMSGRDWSKEIVEEATIDDLDQNAVKRAVELFVQKEGNRNEAQELLNTLSDVELLNKAGITFRSKITRTALLLLGKKEAAFYFDGFVPRITWTLYNADNSIKAYEHFDMPFLLAIDKVFSKIRNEKYRYISGQMTLFPDEVEQYDRDLIKELLNNCIAHSDYRLRGRINIEEYEDHLRFINEGHFIPETIEKALEPGYKPPYYRNAFLCRAMVNLYMIDTNSIGIPLVYSIQRQRCFPLPTYDLDTPNRVSVTVFGKILDKNYTQLLHQNGDLDTRTVFLLDRVQKKLPISKEVFHELKKKHLVEGRYPNIYVAFSIANAVGEKVSYIHNKGLDEKVCRELIIKALSIEPCSRVEIYDVLNKGALPAVLDDKQKMKKVSNILQKMKIEGLIYPKGSRRYTKWYLK